MPRPTKIIQRAFWTAYKGSCAYCRESVRFWALEIEHVIPQALNTQPGLLKPILKKYELPEDFNLESYANKVLSCGRCNGDKSDRLDQPGLVSIGLGKARDYSPLVAKLIEEYKAEKTYDSNLAIIAVGYERGGITKEEIERSIGIVAPILPERPSQSDDDDLLRLFGNASVGLLGWPQTISGIWMDRPELDSLLSGFERERQSFRVLLGEPGSGKSALLAHVGEMLRQDGVALLALKADLLPRELATLAQLDEHLGLSMSLTETIKELAKTRTVVLLVDQVDALGSLMDQHTSRLTVLLGLINRIRGVDDVHILLSCREFEFRHDVRLSGLHPEQVHLADPSWAQASNILTAVGVDSTQWSQELRDLLRRPQHLNLFVRQLAEYGMPTFSSYHGMMESVLRERVARPFGESALELLERIATVMSDEEELWISTSRLRGNHAELIDRLVAADILRYSDNNVRVGFRHQTLFDFVRARAFTGMVSNLRDFVIRRQDALFMRPTLWSTLRYMREADRKHYHQQLQSLWDQPDLRQHVRFLVISFLAQVADPDQVEVEIFLPAFDNSKLRPEAIKCAQGSRVWFLHLQPRLASMMRGDDNMAWQASWILRRALKWERNLALKLIEENWASFPARDGLIIHTLGDLEDWDERAIRVAERALRRTPHNSVYFRRLDDIAYKSSPALAPRLVAAELWGLLERSKGEPLEVPEPPGEDAAYEDQMDHYLRYGDATYRAAKKIATDTIAWHELSKVASAAPREFVEHVWPWIEHVCATHARPTGNALRYRSDPVFDIDGDSFRGHPDLMTAVEVAIKGFAVAQPAAFLEFAEANDKSDLLTVHRLLAEGRAELGQQYAVSSLTYLLGDKRRLALGSEMSSNAHAETRKLIETIASNLGQGHIRSLENAVREWNYWNPEDLVEAEPRLERILWNRAQRLSILLAIPTAVRTPETAKYIEEEERALRPSPTEAGSETASIIGSLVSAKQMAEASDEALVNLFTELHDGTGWNHPKDWESGGAIQTSREFGELAKTNPSRAIRLLQDLRPEIHEQYVAEALRAMSEQERSNRREIVPTIHDLDRRGFQSDTFRTAAAWALAKVAEKDGGLDDSTCSLLERWLTDWTGLVTKSSVETATSPEKLETILWSRRGGIVPGGNYPPLHAIFLGYLCRKPEEPNRWIAVLDRHLTRREAPQVWVGLAHHELRFLGRGSQPRAAALLEHLLLADPPCVDHEDFVGLLARIHIWLPPAISHLFLEHWSNSGWSAGPQAVAEMAMLRHLLVPEDEYCRNIVNAIFRGTSQDDGKDRLKFGVTYALAEMWSVEQARTEATRMLLELLPSMETDLARAWLQIFNEGPLSPDDCTRRILDGLIANPQLLIEAQHGRFVERMKELVQSSIECERVCKILIALMDLCGPQVGDIRTSWAASAEDLINIALTLQRFPQTRMGGLVLFERLMEVNAYKVDDILFELDRRWQ